MPAMIVMDGAGNGACLTPFAHLFLRIHTVPHHTVVVRRLASREPATGAESDSTTVSCDGVSDGLLSFDHLAASGHPGGTLFAVTCSPCLQARGFSVHRRRHSYDSPKGLPGPLDVSRRVLITVHDETALGAHMGPH